MSPQTHKIRQVKCRGMRWLEPPGATIHSSNDGSSRSTQWIDWKRALAPMVAHHLDSSHPSTQLGAYLLDLLMFAKSCQRPSRRRSQRQDYAEIRLPARQQTSEKTYARCWTCAAPEKGSVKIVAAAKCGQQSVKSRANESKNINGQL